jgi:hypothetical protein
MLNFFVQLLQSIFEDLSTRQRIEIIIGDLVLRFDPGDN